MLNTDEKKSTNIKKAYVKQYYGSAIGRKKGQEIKLKKQTLHLKGCIFSGDAHEGV